MIAHVLNFEEQTLDRIGQRIDKAWERLRDDFVEGSIEAAQALRDGRQRFPADQAFSRWMNENQHNHWNKNDRAALLGLSRDLNLAKEVLMQAGSRSYELIWRQVKDRFPNDRKPKPGSAAKVRTPPVGAKERHAMAVYDRLTLEGRTFSRPDLAKAAGVSPGTAARAYTRRQMEEAVRGKTVSPLDIATAAPSVRERMEAWQRAERKRLHDSIYNEVSVKLRDEYQAIVGARLKRADERVAWAQRCLNHYKGIMPKRDYLTIVKCLHPDTKPDDALKAEAFRLFTQHEDVLLKPEPKPLDPRTPPLPETAADLERGREKVKAERAARRAAAQAARATA